MSASDAPPLDDGAAQCTTGREEIEALLLAEEDVERRLDAIRRDLDGAALRDVLWKVRLNRGIDAAGMLGDVLEHVEQALRSLKVLESELHAELGAAPVLYRQDGLPRLPPFMARFLAERAESPRFTCEVGQDPVRGWIIRWKEYTGQGTVRGAGQIYERPYAWLDDEPPPR